MGRKCEFGLARNAEDQFRDILNGKQRLQNLVAPFVDSIFTPPWNRCTDVTIGCLVELGYRVLSRDITATPIDPKGLCELPVKIDWHRRQKGGRIAPDALGRLLVKEVLRTEDAIGIMLHHEIMDAEELCSVDELLGLLATHKFAQCRLMRTFTGIGGTESKFFDPF